MRRLSLFLLCCTLLACSGNEDPGTNTETDDDVLWTINSVSAQEDAGSFAFIVRTSKPLNFNQTIWFETLEVTATSDSDYINQRSGLTLAAGTSSKELVIEIVADSIREDDEQFEVRIYDPTAGTVSNDIAVGTILNDDQSFGVTGPGYSTPLEYPGYELVWSDEFSGNSVNASNWRFETGATGWGNNELQNYTENNATVAGGLLTIEARQESDGTYTSARMITADKQEFAFGRIDIRARLPEGQGIWPALWMLGANFWDIGWPACGEIDIMELVGHEPDKVHGTLHWGEQGWSFSASHTSEISLSSGKKFSDEFHVFSIEWAFDSIIWYLNDQPYFQIDRSVTGNLPYPFNAEFFFIFNIAVGGNWPGNPDATTIFPQTMDVDYVRVFQRN